jgi:hypothetical protein
MISDDETKYIIASKNTKFLEDHYYPNRQPFMVNEGYNVVEVRYDANHAKTSFDYIKVLCNKVKSVKDVMRIVMSTCRYKKALSEYTRKFEGKDTDYYESIVLYDRKCVTIDDDQYVYRMLYLSNPNNVNGFGFERIDNFISNDKRYSISKGDCHYYMMYTTIDYMQGMPGKPDYKRVHSDYPLCLACFVKSKTTSNRLVYIDRLPEYHSIKDWNTLLVRSISNELRRLPDISIYYIPKDDEELAIIKKLGFVQVEDKNFYYINNNIIGKN